MVPQEAQEVTKDISERVMHEAQEVTRNISEGRDWSMETLAAEPYRNKEMVSLRQTDTEGTELSAQRLLGSVAAPAIT